MNEECSVRRWERMVFPDGKSFKMLTLNRGPEPLGSNA